MTEDKPKRGKSRNRQKPITVQISPEKTLTIDELRELCALNPWRSNLQTFDDVLMLCEAVPWEYRRFAGEAVPDIWEIIHRFDIDNKQLYRVMHGEWGMVLWDGGPPRPKSEQSDLEKRAAAEVTQIVCNLESSKNFLEFREYINANPVSAEAVIHMLYFYHNQCASEKDRTDALSALILEIVKEQPKIKRRELLKALEKHKGGGCIETIDEGLIEWTDFDGIVDDLPISSLKDRLSRAKKKLKKNFARTG